MPSYTDRELGRLITRAHYQAWRTDAPPLDLTVDELAAILPNLIKSGSAGLIWPRVEPVRERYGALAFALEAAYNSIHEYNERAQDAIAAVVGRLNDADIQPILVKGWSMSRQYPAPLLRPAGDIDLVVRKHEYAFARAIIDDSTKHGIGTDIDLKHPAIWKERPSKDFWKRTHRIQVRGTSVKTLGDADCLDMLCIHFARHKYRRPLWACDVALALELVDVSMAYRQGALGHGIRSDWVTVTLAIVATMILDSRYKTPQTGSPTVPEWLIPTIERKWGLNVGVLPKASQDLKNLGFWRTLRRRWPDPIDATVECNVSFGTKPPLPLQWKAYILKFQRRLIMHAP